MLSQAWATVAGLMLDMVGVGLLAIEWMRAFKHAFEIRDQEIHAAYERAEARERGEKAEDTMALEDEGNAKDFSKMHHSEGNVRRTLVFTGLGLILLGFLLQVAGAWPSDA